jgi:hypothetical protein
MMNAPTPDDVDEVSDGLESDPCSDAVVATEAAAKSCPSSDPLLHEAAAAAKAHKDKYHLSDSTESYAPLSAGAREAIVGSIEGIEEALNETLGCAKTHGESNAALAYADRQIARGFVAARESLRRLLKADLAASKRLMERKRAVEVDVDCLREVD